MTAEEFALVLGVYLGLAVLVVNVVRGVRSIKASVSILTGYTLD